ncbi:phosphotransferase family protein [Fonsecaea pedrosoi]|nr:phosphotransferase family protein [Fonsecaea pedrosoi]
MELSEEINQDLFEYTSGRWLYNESLRLSERRLVFNVRELNKIAAKCLRQPASEVKEISKLAEGGFNRVFQITMKDGSEVLARLPYPSTKPCRFAVASEAATLDLVRSAGVPTPKVLYYSTDAQNPVGAEFMIMEKLPGRPIGDMWFDLTEDQRLKIILEVVQAEAKLSRIDLPAYGSVYYEHDLPTDTSRAVITSTSDIKGLCIGPHTSLRWWYKEREFMEFNRGPTKELAWLKAFGRPRLPFQRAYRECMNYEKSQPEEHAESLEKYMRLAPYLVPSEPRFHRPVLRHPDLQPSNIFVSENLDIVGIIDWQHCTVLPQFLAAGIPKYFQNYHDEASLSFVPPKLPENLAEMDDEERSEALERFRRRHLHFFYLGFTQRFNKAHYEILDRRTDLLTRKIFSHAGEPWEGNNIPLKADLIYIMQIWEKIMNENGYFGKGIPSCPISFTELDIQRTIDILLQQEDIDTQLEKIQNAIGINADGWTSNEEYEEAVGRAKLIKMQALASLDSEEEKEMTLKHWPFDDFDEQG